MECYGMGHRKTCHVRMLKADSVEETIWSPILGLKGKVEKKHIIITTSHHFWLDRCHLSNRNRNKSASASAI